MDPRPIACPRCGRMVGIIAKKPAFPVNIDCLCGNAIPIGAAPAGQPPPVGQPPPQKAKASAKKKKTSGLGAKRSG
ncbi:MAG: hypothetical protein ACM3QZ_01115 [Solirubrobacterales bacterium]